jgi:hypothetical protein
VYRIVCDLFGADEGGIGGDLRLDLRVGQPCRVALRDGVLLAKFRVDPVPKVLPCSGIEPILRVRTSFTATDARVDPFDQTTKSGANHGTNTDGAFIDAMPILRLRLLADDQEHPPPRDQAPIVKTVARGWGTFVSAGTSPTFGPDRGDGV